MARKTLPAPRRPRRTAVVAARRAGKAAERPPAPRKEKRPATTRPTTRARAAKVPRTPPSARLPIEFLAVPPDERVLALDTSSRCIGWSLYDRGALARSGKLRLTDKGHGAKRLAFRAWLRDLLRDTDPHHLLVEQPYAGRFKSTFAILSRYVGVVEEVHVEHFGRELPKEDQVPAHEVKRAIGARRVKAASANEAHSRNKQVVLDLVNQAFGLQLRYVEGDETKRTSDDDRADAIAVNWAWHLLNRAPAEADATD